MFNIWIYKTYINTFFFTFISSFLYLYLKDEPLVLRLLIFFNCLIFFIKTFIIIVFRITFPHNVILNFLTLIYPAIVNIFYYNPLYLSIYFVWTGLDIIIAIIGYFKIKEEHLTREQLKYISYTLLRFYIMHFWLSGYVLLSNKYIEYVYLGIYTVKICFGLTLFYRSHCFFEVVITVIYIAYSIWYSVRICNEECIVYGFAHIIFITSDTRFLIKTDKMFCKISPEPVSV